jgi:nitronate monooxygenase
MIHDDATVGEVIERMCAGAESLLAGWASLPRAHTARR